MASAAVAALDELHQASVPTRTGSLLDVLTDVVGASLAVAAVVAFFRRASVRDTGV